VWPEKSPNFHNGFSFEPHNISLEQYDGTSHLSDRHPYLKAEIRHRVYDLRVDPDRHKSEFDSCWSCEWQNSIQIEWEDVLHDAFEILESGYERTWRFERSM